MGVWGAKSFENDDALDWVADLDEANDIEPVTKALNYIVNGDSDYLEIPECPVAVAGAEIVAALRGFPVSDPSDEVQDWIENKKPSVSPDLIKLALRALEKITSDSELKDVWEESDNASEWLQAIGDLKRRLGEK